jgi:hypothetical protein
MSSVAKYEILSQLYSISIGSSVVTCPAEEEDEEGEQNGIPQRTRKTARDRDSSDRRFSTRSGKICEERKSG